MADANGLVEAMKRAARDEREASKPVNVYFGTVVSESPLKISVEQKMALGEAQLVLSRNVTDYAVEINADWETEETGGGSGEGSFDGHSHRISGRKRITVHNALRTGEEVILIRQQEGQKFIVADRTGRTGGAG